MLEFLQNMNIDWYSILSVIWTVVLVPIGTQIYKWLESKKLDKYAQILYEEAVNAVKSVQQAIVDDIKGTEYWTSEKQVEVRELAKVKIKQALSTSVLKCLHQANEDFDSYLGNLIESAIFDVKHGLK